MKWLGAMKWLFVFAVGVIVLASSLLARYQDFTRPGGVRLSAMAVWLCCDLILAYFVFVVCGLNFWHACVRPGHHSQSEANQDTREGSKHRGARQHEGGIQFVPSYFLDFVFVMVAMGFLGVMVGVVIDIGHNLHACFF